MEIIEYSLGKNAGLKNATLALGYFDGVHLGHRELILEGARSAKENNGDFAVFTFTEESFNTKGGSLYSTEEKLTLLNSIGVNKVVLADFQAVKDIPAEDFVKNVLVRDLGCSVAITGKDFRYGKNRCGTADLLKADMERLGKRAFALDDISLFGKKISTTRIKELLLRGEPDVARELLGVPYFERSPAVHGLGLGKKLGFPTVNFPDDKEFLRTGVYRTAVFAKGRLYNAVTNVGTCPTFNEREKHRETFIIDFFGDLYDEEIYVFYLGYLRDEIKFDSEEALTDQIKIDVNRTIKENGELKWQEIGLNLQ